MGDPFKITPGPNGPRLGSGITVTPTFLSTQLANETFPVVNAELQWYISAENAPLGNANSLSVYGSGGSGYPFNNTPELSSAGLQWQIGSTANGNAWVYSYTSLYGKTVKYISIPGKCDYSTTYNSYNYADIVANGGFTFWLIRIPDPGPAVGWHRYLWYNGMSADQYGSASWFNNDTSSGVASNQTQVPGHPAQVGALSWSSYGPTMNSADIEFLIVTFSGTYNTQTVTGYYTRENYVRSTEAVRGTNQLMKAPSTTSSQGTRLWTMQNTVAAKPYFNDDTYTGAGQNAANRCLLMEAGWANRPYNANEVSSLLNFIKAKYIGP